MPATLLATCQDSDSNQPCFCSRVGIALPTTLVPTRRHGDSICVLPNASIYRFQPCGCSRVGIAIPATLLLMCQYSGSGNAFAHASAWCPHVGIAIPAACDNIWTPAAWLLMHCSGDSSCVLAIASPWNFQLRARSRVGIPIAAACSVTRR